MDRTGFFRTTLATLLILNKVLQEIIMIARMLSLAVLIASTFLSGCVVAPMPGVRFGGQGTYVGRHGAVTLGGSTVPVQQAYPVYNGVAPVYGNNTIVYGGAPMQYGTQIYGTNTLSPNACPGGYRYVNGTWVCGAAVVNNGVVGMPVYNQGLPAGMSCPPGSYWDSRGCRTN